MLVPTSPAAIARPFHGPGACACHPDRRRFLAMGAGTVAVGAALGTQTEAQIAAAPPKRGPLIDAHMHLQAPEWFRSSVFARPEPPPRRRASPRPPTARLVAETSLIEPDRAARVRSYGPTIAEQTRRILDEMDEAGIDTAILYAMDYDYTGEKLRVDHYEQIRQLAEVRDRNPGKFVLFAAVDPRRPKGGVEMLRRLHTDFRISGMGEFAPHFFGFAPNDRERCYPLYEACAELGLHIAPNCSIITPMISRWCDPAYFEDVATDFPQINVCLTSAGKPHWKDTAIALAQSKANVFLDTADWQARTTSDPIGTVIDLVRTCLDTEARHKILFGSDHPVYAGQVSVKRWADVFRKDAAARGRPFSEAELHLFFSDNAQEFLNIDLPMPAARRN